jgi:hypothetical protein
MNSYTVETQLFPTLAAIVMSIQYSVDNYTQMAFLYMSVATHSTRNPKLIISTCQGKIPAVMLMGGFHEMSNILARSED